MSPLLLLLIVLLILFAIGGGVWVSNLLWLLLVIALVDPDNRRPVDWTRLSELLDEEPLSEPKLRVTSRLLRLRRERPEAFAGGYMPVAASPDVCAFMRGPDLLVVVPLSPSARPDVDVAGSWTDVLEERFPFRVYLNG